MIRNLEKLTRSIDQSNPRLPFISWEKAGEVSTSKATYPLFTFSIGTPDPTSPLLFITGGVHGLERIGSQLAWSLLKTTIDRLHWDQSLVELFQHIRMVVIPLVNPAGYMLHTRSNARGVDLMRNAPITAVEKTPWLLGGQTHSPRLPWFRGSQEALEVENQILKDTFLKNAAQTPTVISVDFHSGFGLRDRLWFPFSYTAAPFDDLAEMSAFTYLFEQTHPYHVYRIEPQSHGYLLNGDMWDYLYLELKKKNPSTTYLPLTLEMGSWAWVRKNPLQLFSRHGVFNPMKEHRLKRTFRRHHLLFDFILKALRSNQNWALLPEATRERFRLLAIKRWYK